MNERITGVAILSHDGRMWSLPAPARHANLFALAAFQGVDPEPCFQGFTTSAGRFVDRECAALIVQADPSARPFSKLKLYSEDLW